MYDPRRSWSERTSCRRCCPERPSGSYTQPAGGAITPVPAVHGPGQARSLPLRECTVLGLRDRFCIRWEVCGSGDDYRSGSTSAVRSRELLTLREHTGSRPRRFLPLRGHERSLAHFVVAPRTGRAYGNPAKRRRTRGEAGGRFSTRTPPFDRKREKARGCPSTRMKFLAGEEWSYQRGRPGRLLRAGGRHR